MKQVKQRGKDKLKHCVLLANLQMDISEKSLGLPCRAEKVSNFCIHPRFLEVCIDFYSVKWEEEWLKI